MATTDERVGSLEQQVSSVMAKVDMLIQEMRDFKSEMRDRDNQRAAEIMELRQKQDAAQAKHETEMHEMNQRFYEKIDSIGNQIHDTWRQTMLGVGGMIIAVGALLFAALK